MRGQIEVASGKLQKTVVVAGRAQVRPDARRAGDGEASRQQSTSGCVARPDTSSAARRPRHLAQSVVAVQKLAAVRRLVRGPDTGWRAEQNSNAYGQENRPAMNRRKATLANSSLRVASARTQPANSFMVSLRLGDGLGKQIFVPFGFWEFAWIMP
jgi:hypothetical protein